VKKALKAYEQYQQEQHGENSVEDSYALLSEPTQSKFSVFQCLHFRLLDVRFSSSQASTDSALLGEERLPFRPDIVPRRLLAPLGKEINVRRQLRSVIDELLEAKKKQDVP